MQHSHFRKGYTDRTHFLPPEFRFSFFSNSYYKLDPAIVSNTDVSFLGVQKEVFNPFFKIYIFPFYTRGRIQISLYLAFYPNLCFGYFLKSVCRKLCQMCRGV